MPSVTLKDIAAGVGIIKFYLFASELAGGFDYHLGQNIVYSGGEPANTGAVDSKVGTGLALDLDFDVTEFTGSRTIGGTATLNIGHECLSNSGSEVTSTITARIRKWDGSTETPIASAVSETLNSSAQILQIRIHNMPIVIPKTVFARGETLRLSIAMTSVVVSGSGGIAGFGHDPQNRDGSLLLPATQAVITSSNIEMPFDLENI